jgi:hypothetical protein
MRKVQWSWVKGHNGHLLNEVADSLATMGVQNLTPFENVQYLHPLNEDPDHETDVISEAEETPGLTEKANLVPEMAFAMKDGDNLADHISGPTPVVTPQSTPQVSAYPSASLSNASPVSLSELEDSDTQPQRPESEPEEDPITKGVRMAEMISRSLRIAEALSRKNTEPVRPLKPT